MHPHYRKLKGCAIGGEALAVWKPSKMSWCVRSLRGNLPGMRSPVLRRCDYFQLFCGSQRAFSGFGKMALFTRSLMFLGWATHRLKQYPSYSY